MSDAADLDANTRIPSPEQVENHALKERRRHVGVPEDAKLIGLALSGGGIRSATFCLGVLRGLARNRVLHRFDYLSTVSGGGYVGAALCRLFSGRPGGDAKTVEERLPDESTGFIWWLRTNGRFLAPAGHKDLLLAWSGHFRGFIATQVEVAALSLLIACVVTLPHLVYATLPVEWAQLLVGGSVWWWILPLLLGYSSIHLYGFWYLGRISLASVMTVLIASTVCVALGFKAYLSPPGIQQQVWIGCATFLAPAPFAWISAFIASRTNRKDVNRVRFNARFAAGLKFSMMVVLLGCVDLLSWGFQYRLTNTAEAQPGPSLLTSAISSTLILAVARALLPLLDKLKSGAAHISWLRVAQILGYAMLAATVLFWSTIFQMLLFPPDQGGAGFFGNAWARWLAAFSVVALFLLANGRTVRQLNTSSLHLFYRSRLARTYVAVGNAPPTMSAPGARFPKNILAAYTRPDTLKVAKVTELMPGDDTLLEDYMPHAFGGPIHLINCCINQTVDDRTGGYNADRKGICLTISAFGVETGTHLHMGHMSPELKRTSLAKWIAISGAAVASGMGSQTRSGVAALLFLSGLRLGFWQRNLEDMPPRQKWLPKYRAAVAEMLAMFPGARSADWYVSDGGHFDNTGIYALLKRELSTIVVADCGADPSYSFSDIENLIRKARIDYDASIDFLDPSQPPFSSSRYHPLFGTPNSISSTPGDACLLLGRIRYASGKIGSLLVIKPRLRRVLPLDIAGYADRESTFPQQSTSQQFFDESQWESYFHLGEILTGSITSHLLADLSELVEAAPEPEPTDQPLSSNETRRPKNRRLAAAIGTSIGLGTVLAAVITCCQESSGGRAQDMAERASETERYKKLSDDIHSIEVELSKAATLEPSLRVTLSAFADDLAMGDLADTQKIKAKRLIKPLTNICNLPSDGQGNIVCGQALDALKKATSDKAGPWDEAFNAYSRWRGRPAEVTEQGVVPPSKAATQTDISGHRDAPPSSTEASTSQRPLPSSATVSLRTTASSSQPAKELTTQSGADVSVLTQAAVDACAGVGGPFTVYTQVYDEPTRQVAAGLTKKLSRIGLVVPGIENVNATATAKGLPAPYPWKTTTILYSAGGNECAGALAGWLNSNREAALLPARAVALPPGLGRTNTLELWIPPSH